MAVKTLTVEHVGSHAPSKDQVRDALKDAGVKRSGDFDFTLVENTSNGPSKVQVTFEPAEDAPTTAKTAAAK